MAKKWYLEFSDEEHARDFEKAAARAGLPSSDRGFGFELDVEKLVAQHECDEENLAAAHEALELKDKLLTDRESTIRSQREERLELSRKLVGMEEMEMHRQSYDHSGTRDQLAKALQQVKELTSERDALRRDNDLSLEVAERLHRSADRQAVRVRTLAAALSVLGEILENGE